MLAWANRSPIPVTSTALPCILPLRDLRSASWASLILSCQAGCVSNGAPRTARPFPADGARGHTLLFGRYLMTESSCLASRAMSISSLSAGMHFLPRITHRVQAETISRPGTTVRKSQRLNQELLGRPRFASLGLLTMVIAQARPAVLRDPAAQVEGARDAGDDADWAGVGPMACGLLAAWWTGKAFWKTKRLAWWVGIAAWRTGRATWRTGITAWRAGIDAGRMASGTDLLASGTDIATWGTEIASLGTGIATWRTDMAT